MAELRWAEGKTNSCRNSQGQHTYFFMDYKPISAQTSQSLIVKSQNRGPRARSSLTSAQIVHTLRDLRLGSRLKLIFSYCSKETRSTMQPVDAIFEKVQRESTKQSGRAEKSVIRSLETVTFFRFKPNWKVL